MKMEISQTLTVLLIVLVTEKRLVFGGVCDGLGVYPYFLRSSTSDCHFVTCTSPPTGPAIEYDQACAPGTSVPANYNGGESNPCTLIQACQDSNTDKHTDTVSPWSVRAAGLNISVAESFDGSNSSCVSILPADLPFTSAVLRAVHDDPILGATFHVVHSGLHCGPRQDRNCEAIQTTAAIDYVWNVTSIRTCWPFCGGAASCEYDESSSAGECIFKCECPSGATCRRVALIIGQDSFTTSQMDLCELHFSGIIT